MIYEIISIILLLIFFTFPLWTHNNWKTIISKEEREYRKELRKRKNGKPIITEEYGKKICTQYQPFKLNEKESGNTTPTYIICNFVCNGDCQFKGYEYYNTRENL